MKTRLTILFLAILLIADTRNSSGQDNNKLSFDFYGNPVVLTPDPSLNVQLGKDQDTRAIQDLCQSLVSGNHSTLVTQLLAYKNLYKLDDWLYYQLIRKTAQGLSPKADNYYRYTIYKWFLLTRSGYNATLKISPGKLLFYVQTDENIYNIPYYIREGKQFVCLNYHDYGGHIDFEQETFREIMAAGSAMTQPFSYKVNRLPEFKPSDYQEKDLQFSYNNNDYHFKVKLNSQIKNIFANYPVVDYESYLNIPLSRETYGTLIPLLKKKVKGMSKKNGVDYLMQFTRYAFLFESDSKTYGKEKRLTPEQTLLYEHSDCEDRVALFFCLVKEIYNLPMIVLTYPEHVTIAVRFERPVGTPIIYNGMKYSVCEPTPQKQNLAMGQLMPNLAKSTYEVVYAYNPLH